jgi:hypothetical protein
MRNENCYVDSPCRIRGCSYCFYRGLLLWNMPRIRPRNLGYFVLGMVAYAALDELWRKEI